MRALASLKIFAIWCTTFVESILYLSQKSTKELCVITMKSDAKFEKELTSALKNDMRNLANFDPTLKSVKICTFMGSFWPKYIMFELKNTEGLCVIILKISANLEGKMTCGLKNDMHNLVDFTRELKNLKITSLENTCWFFSNLYISLCVGKKFKFMIFTLLENALNPGIFTHAPIPHSKLQAEPFKICFPKQ